MRQTAGAGVDRRSVKTVVTVWLKGGDVVWVALT